MGLVTGCHLHGEQVVKNNLT